MRGSLLATLFAGIVLVLGILCHAGGYLHWESSAFLLHYTADRPLLKIIFDPAKNDWGLYQCRELSYFVDWLDAQAVYQLLLAGYGWFISLAAILLSLFTLWFQQYAGRRLFSRLPGVFFTLHALAFALLPALTESLFFRSSKFLAAAGITVLVFGTALRCRFPGCRWGKLSVLGAAALAASFSDRQGIFFVTAFTGIISVMQLLHPRRILQKVIFLCAGIILFQAAANLWIVPWIIKELNGYQADFSYQGNFQTDLSLFRSGVIFFTANLGHAFTGLNSLDAALPAGGVVFLFLLFLQRRQRHLPGWVFCGAVLSVIVCSGLMVSRHPPLLDKDVIFANYFLPSLALLTFFYFAALSCLPERFLKVSFILPLLAILLRLQPYLFPEQLFKTDKYQKTYQEASGKFRYFLAHPDCPYKMLLMPGRMERLAEKLLQDGLRGAGMEKQQHR